MKTTHTPLQYTLLTYRLDQLWLPAAFWALFILVVWFIRDQGNALNVASGFLSGVLPLIGGILAAYAVLDDPALELHFASPRPAWRVLLERLGLILAILAAAALTYQGFLELLGVHLASLGSLGARQLVWLAPSAVMVALGSAAAFSLASTTSGAMLVGLVWIFEVILRSWFASDRWARYFALFLGVQAPDHPALRANQACLVGLAVVLILAAWVLLKKQERYL